MVIKGPHQVKHNVVTQSSRSPKRQIFQFWRENQWLVVLIFLPLSLVLGYIGFYKFNQATAGGRSLTDLLYLTLQLTTLESGAVSGPVSWELEVARLLVPLMTAYTAILAVAVIFRKQLQMVRLWMIRNQVIICGLGEKGWLLANQLNQAGYCVVIIEKESDNPKNEACREKRMIVIEGDASQPYKLKQAGLHRASHLIAVCGDDSVNVEVALAASELSSVRRKGVLSCAVHITDPDLCTLLRDREFGLEPFPKIRLEIFNIYEMGARILVNEHLPFIRTEVESQSAPNILVVGMGRFGESVVIQAARRWYDARADQTGMLTISLVDEKAEEKAACLNLKYPTLAECCELKPYSIDLEDPQFDKVETLCLASSIFICLSDPIHGLQTALNLRQQLNRNQPPIVVRMQEDSGLSKLLVGEDEPAVPFHNIVPFGLVQRTCTPDLVLGGMHEILAQAVHEDYLSRRLEEGLLMGEKRSMVTWHELPEDLRESNRRQVDHIRLKLQTAGYGIKPLSDWGAANYQFTAPEIEKMAKMEHDQWVQERITNGWQYQSGVEDAEKKVHPDLQPWEELSENIKEKDRQPVIKIPALLARAGFQVYRLSE